MSKTKEEIDVVVKEKTRRPRRGRPKRKVANRQRRGKGYRRDRIKRGSAINSVSIPRPGNTFKVPRSLRTNKKKMNAWKVLSKHAKQYCAAVVSPFDEKATGALIPDGFKEDTVALTDVFSFSFNPYDFSTNPYSAVGNPGIIGIMAAFVPRCRKAGWNFGPTIHKQNNQIAYDELTAETPMYPVSDKLLPLSYNATTNSPGDAYTLVVCGVDESGRPRIIFEDPEAPGVFVDSYGYYQIRYTRYLQLISNINALRLVGAGVKMGTTAAPILSGGYCYCGSAKQGEFYQVLSDAFTGQQDLTQWIKTNLQDQYRGKGVRGMMARLPYDPDTLDNEPKAVNVNNQSEVITVFTSKSKMSKIYSKDKLAKIHDIEEAHLGMRQRRKEEIKKQNEPKRRRLVPTYEDEEKKTEGGLGDTPAATYELTVISYTSDPGAQDLTSVSAEIPVLYWSYASADQNNTYAVDMYSTVHSEGVPKAICPFGSAQVEKDLFLQYIQEEVLTDTSMFPISHSGNSFAKFADHLKTIVGAVGKGAGKLEQALKLLFD